MLLSLLLLGFMTSLYLCLVMQFYPQKPNLKVAGAFLWGLTSFGVALLLQTLLLRSGLAESQFLHSVSAPILEETFKALPLLAFVYSARKVDSAWMVIGFTIGVGFALPESMLYALQNPDYALATTTGRILSTNLIHGFTTGLLGFLFVRLPAKHRVTAGLLSAATIHSAYNLLVYTLDGGLLVFIAANVGMVSLAIILILLARTARTPLSIPNTMV